MKVTIEGIEQFLKLGGKFETINSLRIRLPDGTLFAASVDNAIIERLIFLANQEAVTGEELTEDGVFGGEPPEVLPEEEQMIDWANLPDSVLPQEIKKELSGYGYPPVVRASELAAARELIAERLRTKEQPAVRTIPAQLQQVPRPRTVPKDEMGYPVVPNRPSDPGEVALAGDEDGVPQL